VWEVERQDLKAETEDAAAWVASVLEAEEAWWMVLEVLAWVTGMVVCVWMGLLSIQRGTVDEMFEVIVNESQYFKLYCSWFRSNWLYRRYIGVCEREYISRAYWHHQSVQGEHDVIAKPSRSFFGRCHSTAQDTHCFHSNVA